MAAGLDRLHISVQGIDPKVYRSLMFLDLKPVIKNIERAVEIKERNNYATKIRVVMLDTRDIHPHLDDIRAFWKERGVGINVNQMENRGTHTDITTAEISARQLSRFQWCDRLFRQAYVLYDGRMVQCCSDWEQTNVLGDLSQDSLLDVWNGGAYMNFRQRFLDGDLKGSICHGCMKDPGNKA